MDGLFYVGKSVPRIDGAAKVTGSAEYGRRLPSRHALREGPEKPFSPRTHSIYRYEQGGAAPRREGGRHGERFPFDQHGFVQTGRYPADQYPIAVDRVRHVGEEVAGVAAIDESTAEEALSLIKVDYECCQRYSTRKMRCCRTRRRYTRPMKK